MKYRMQKIINSVKSLVFFQDEVLDLFNKLEDIFEKFHMQRRSKPSHACLAKAVF